jgi:lactoylglutathione lyase
MRGITSIGHIAIRVKDIDRSLDFYVGKLGFAEMFRLDRDGKLWIVYLRITDDQYLELFPDAVGEQSPPEDTVGLNHFCLTVDDINAVVADIERQGIPLFRPKKFAIDGNWQAWIKDPDGNRIELMQMGDDSKQYQAIRRLAAARAAAAPAV